MAAEGYCTICNIEIASFEGLTECPNCGTDGRPCAFADDMDVRINRHELHVLCVWAERWGMEMATRDEGGPAVVYGAVRRLKERNPALAEASLTLADEVEAIRDAGYWFDTNLPGIEDNPPPAGGGDDGGE